MRISASWLPAFIRNWFLRDRLEKKLEDVQGMVALIRNNKHLREVLLKTKPEFRKAIYEQWKPHLKFKPKPYSLLFK